MKKTILTLFIAAVTVLGYSQETKFGVKGGLNLASLNSVDLENNEFFRLTLKSKTGFHAGIFVEIPITENISIQPEIMYSTQGADFTRGNASGTISYDFVNLPIVFKYYVVEDLSLEAGLQVGYALTGKYEENLSNSKFEVDFIKQVNRLNLGLNFGASYNITKNLVAGLRYNVGLNNLNNDKDESYTATYNGPNDSGNPSEENSRFFFKDFTIKSNTFQLSVGYRF